MKYKYRDDDQFITELKSFVLSNLKDTQLDVKRVCQHFGISRTQLYRKLKASINQSVAEYIRMIRLETAKQLLIQSKLDIAEIAYATGFSSPSHFTRTFKRVFGEVPSDFR